LEIEKESDMSGQIDHRLTMKVGDLIFKEGDEGDLA